MSSRLNTLGRELLEGDYIQADETSVGVQMIDCRGKKGELASGNTVALRGQSYSISGLGVKGKDRNGSLVTSKDCFKAMVTTPMIEWPEPVLSMPVVGSTRSASFDAVKLTPKDQTASNNSAFRKQFSEI